MHTREHKAHYRKVARRDLTPRQKEVLALIAAGLTNAEIGARLGISLDGAKYHVTEILERLEVGSREEAAEWWRDQNSLRSRFKGAVVWLGGLGGWKPAALGAVTAGVAGVGLVALVLVRGDGEPPAEGRQPPPTATSSTEHPPSPTAQPTPTPAPGITDPGEVAASFSAFVEELDERLREGDVSVLTDALITHHVVCTAENTPPQGIGGPDCRIVGEEFEGVQSGNESEGTIARRENVEAQLADIPTSLVPGSDEYGDETFRVYATVQDQYVVVLTALIERPSNFAGAGPLRIAVDTGWVLWGDEWRLRFLGFNYVIPGRVLEPGHELFIFEGMEYELFE